MTDLSLDVFRHLCSMMGCYRMLLLEREVKRHDGIIRSGKRSCIVDFLGFI